MDYNYSRQQAPVTQTTGTQTPISTQQLSPKVQSAVNFSEKAGIGYTQEYLMTQIGSSVRIEFLVGENTLQDRRGTLVDVAIDYLIIRETDTDDLLLCDMYSIKFVTFYR